MVRGGKSELTVRHPVDTLTMRIPRAWTDVDGTSGAPIPCDTQLTVVALRDLLHLVHVLGGRA